MNLADQEGNQTREDFVMEAFLVLADIDLTMAKALWRIHVDGETEKHVAEELGLHERNVRKSVNGYFRGRGHYPGAKDYIRDIITTFIRAERVQLLDEARWSLQRFPKAMLTFLDKAHQASCFGWALLLLAWTRKHSAQRYDHTLGQIIALSNARSGTGVSTALVLLPADDDKFLSSCVRRYLEM